jgi:hypothetical protein
VFLDIYKTELKWFFGLPKFLTTLNSWIKTVDNISTTSLKKIMSGPRVTYLI